MNSREEPDILDDCSNVDKADKGMKTEKAPNPKLLDQIVTVTERVLEEFWKSFRRVYSKSL